jgi:hypothetical protein
MHATVSRKVTDALWAGDRAACETRSGQPLGGLLPSTVSDRRPGPLSGGGGQPARRPRRPVRRDR